MTKEELEKEAEESAKQNCSMPINWNEIDVAERAGYVKGYIAGTESREKQIQIDAEQIIALQKDKGELTDRVTELEAQIEKMKCCYNCKHSRTEYEHCRTDKHEKWEIKEND